MSLNLKDTFFLLQATGVKLCAESKLSEPKVIDVVEMIPNKGALGKAFKKDASLITEAMAALSIDQVRFCSKLEKRRMGRRLIAGSSLHKPKARA